MSAAGIYWLIPIVLILALVAAALLVRAWIRDSREQVGRAGARLRKFSAVLTRLEAAGRDYTPDAAGPYARPASELSSALEAIHRQIKTHADRYFAVRQAMRRADPGSFEAIVRSPFAWYAVRRQLAELQRQSVELEEALDSAASTAEQLQRMGWQVAEKARDFDNRLEQASEIAQELHAAHVSGAAFQDAVRTGGRLRSVVQTVPVFFLSGEPDAVLSLADRETIIRIDALLEENTPALAELLAGFQAWKQQFDEASEHLSAFGKAIDQLRSTTLNPPAGLQLDRAETRLHQMEQAAADLRNRLAEPDAGDLRTLLQEARTTARTAQADVLQIDAARQQVGELKESIRALSARLHQTGAVMAESERAERRPLAWDRSRSALALLGEKLAAIGEPAAERLPEQVVKDLSAVHGLAEAAEGLSQAVNEAVGQYNRLIPLLEGMDPKTNAERHAVARRLALQAPAYAPDNWPRTDAVAEFPQDLAQVMRQVEEIVPPEPGAPLLESRLAGQLAAAEAAAEQYQALFERTDRIEKRLADLESLETGADQKLNLVVSLFNQIDALAASNEVLAQVTGRVDTEKLWQEGQRLADELFNEERRRQGKVEKKAQKVDSFYQRVEAAANTWLNKVQAAGSARRAELTGKLDRLSQIAPLEDPLLGNAERLLAEEPAEPAAKGVTNALPQLMSELKRQNDVYLRLSSMTAAVETEVESEVVAAYEAGVNQRQASIEKLEMAHRRLPGTPAWPPTTQNLDEEIQAFEEVEGRWEALRAGPLRANRLILLLGEIARGYQAVEAQIDRRLERAEAERDRIAALEQSIDEAAQLWQAQAGRRDPETRDVIGQLLDDVREQIEALRQRVAQGRAPYSQVEQELRALSRQINDAQVPAEGGLIDINGG